MLVERHVKRTCGGAESGKHKTAFALKTHDRRSTHSKRFQMIICHRSFPDGTCLKESKSILHREEHFILYLHRQQMQFTIQSELAPANVLKFLKTTSEARDMT